MSQSRVLIVGAGLIGCSIGLALREAGWVVTITDVDEAATREAVRLTGLMPATDPVDVDVVVVAVPPTAVAKTVVGQIQLHPNATVIDVASVKTELTAEIYAMSTDSSRYVPTHPMAGKETSGPAAAAFDLFVDRLWVYSADSATNSNAVRDAIALIEACGAIAVPLPVGEHDSTVALTSHLPQLLSSALAGLLTDEPESHVAVSGQGLRDMTRLAGSNPSLWTEILLANRTHVSGRLEQLSTRLREVKAHLEEGNLPALTAALRLGNQGRAMIPGKHGTAPREWATVAIVINDAPGQLAAIFACAGKLEINIEDVRIDHALGRAAAVIELDVDPQVALTLAQGLAAEGWTLRHLPDFE